MQYRRDAGLIALVLMAMLVLVFSRFVFGGFSIMSSSEEVPSTYADGASYALTPLAPRTLDPGAPGWTTDPWLALEHRILFDERRLPFWDPYDGYGTPFDASMQSQPFYPLTAALSIHPTPRLYAFWVLARLFLAGFFAALFVRLFAGRFGAAAAGCAAMLTGYYLVYYDMPHLSVDVGLPMLLWATELACRRLTPARVAALGGAAALVYLGGMPESALLAMIVAVLYAAVRIAVLAGPKRLAASSGIVAGHLLGLAVGAIQILPFVEFSGRSFNLHDPTIVHWITGLIADPPSPNMVLTEFVPRAFGAPWGSILTNGSGHSGVRGFFGCGAFLLALFALIATWRRRDARTATITFLAAIALYAVLKRYGSPLVNWTGGFPLIQLVNFPKYIEFVLGDTVAILAGFGAAYLRERTTGRLPLAAAFTISLAILTYLFLATRDLVPPTPLAIQYSMYFAVGMLALLTMAGAAAGVVLLDGPRRACCSVVVIALLVIEPFVSYVRPTIWHMAPAISENPYRGAPYLDYLREHVDTNTERIFGVFGILFPNWAGAYGFADPRSLNALYPARYMHFVDAFVSTGPVPFEDQADRFTGVRAIPLTSPLVRRWLALSSIGYILSPRNLGAEHPPGAILDDLWKQVAPSVPAADVPAVHPTIIELDGVTENVFFEHPPHEVTYRTTVPALRPRFLADLALDPASYRGEICGSPLTFSLTAVSGGRTLAGATRTIDPKHLLADRHWIPFTLDLEKLAGRTVDLHFRTSAVDLCSAWAVWGEPRFRALSDRGPLGRSKSIFLSVFSSPGADIYRINGSLPRLQLFHDVRSVNSFDAALAALTAPAFDVRREVVVEGPVPAIAAEREGDKVTVTFARSDRLEASVTAASDGLLMQNDTFYPGWHATLDGNPATIVQTDGLFRGIAVPAGQHHLVIAYDSPVAGFATLFSVLGLLVMAALFAWTPITSRFRTAALG